MRPVLIAASLGIVLSASVSSAPGQTGGAGASSPMGGTSFGIGGPNVSLGVSASQGVTRRLSSQAAVVTVPNGVPGFVGAGTVGPYVTGLVPVITKGMPFGPQRVTPPTVSPIRSALMRGEVRVVKDEAGNARVVIAAPPPPRPPSTAQGSKSDPQKTNAPKAEPDPASRARRAIEKYADRP